MAVENSLQGVVIVQDFRIVSANQAFAEISGYAIEELLSLPPDEVKTLLHPEDQTIVCRRFRDRVAGKQVPSRYEYRVIRKDGEARWVEMLASRIEHRGRPAVQGAIVDITKQKWAEEEISHRTSQLALINEVGQRLVLTSGLTELYKAAVEAVHERAGYEPVAIFSVEDDKVSLEAVAGAPSELIPSEYSQRIGEGMAGWVAQSGQALLANDVTKEPQFMSLGSVDIGAEVDIPIKLGGKTIGVLAVGSGHAGAFSETDVTTLETIAGQIARAIENTRFYEQVRNRNVELSALLDTAQALASSLDLKQVLQTIAHQAKRLTQADGSRIYLIEPDEETLKPVVVLEDYAAAIMGTPLLVGQGITGQVAATGVPEIVTHVECDPRVIQIPGTPKNERCLICVPLVVKGEVIGVMTSSRNREEAFDPDHLRLLSSLASQAAAAVENARLYEETKRLAATDPLTGVWNRHHLGERLRTEVTRASRFGRELSVLVMDVDNLKLFNDAHGHLAGDDVICTVAQAVLTSCRDIDIVGRYGGDELAAILPETGPQGAAVVAARILAALEREPFEAPDGTKVPINISIGAASYPSDSDEIDRLFSIADAVMYNAKVAGGNQFASLSVGPEELPDELVTPFDLVKGLLVTVDAKDHYTFKHSQQVTRSALTLARALRLPEQEIKSLEVAGQLHDVGKIGVRTDILRKPGPLTQEEWKMIYEHPRLGHMLLRQVPKEEAVLQAVLYHHERYDGMGYPAGLKGEEIPLLARILAVADAFSAMSADRPYRKALPLKEALAELRRNAGKQFDPDLAEKFVHLVEEGAIA